MSVVMGWLASSRQKAREPSQSNRLVHPISTLIMGIVCGGFFLALAIVSGFAAKTRGIWLALFFLGFSLLGFPMIIDYYRARHEITDSGLNYGTLFKGRHSLQWNEVTSVRYSLAAKWFLIEVPERPVARISAMLLGLPAFAKAVLKHVPADRMDAQTHTVLEEMAQGRLPRIWQ